MGSKAKHTFCTNCGRPRRLTEPFCPCQVPKPALGPIVALTTFRDKLFVATPNAVFDITDITSPVRIFDVDAASFMELGKKYVMLETHN